MEPYIKVPGRIAGPYRALVKNEFLPDQEFLYDFEPHSYQDRCVGIKYDKR